MIKKNNKDFDLEEKKKIIQSSFDIGVKTTALNYKISTSSIYRWRKEIDIISIDPFQDLNSKGLKKPYSDILLSPNRHPSKINLMFDTHLIKETSYSDLSRRLEEERIARIKKAEEARKATEARKASEARKKREEKEENSTKKEPFEKFLKYLFIIIASLIALYLISKTGGGDYDMPRGRR